MNTAKGIYASAISLASFGYHDSIDDYNKLQGMKDLAGTGYSEVQPNIRYWWNYGQNRARPVWREVPYCCPHSAMRG